MPKIKLSKHELKRQRDSLEQFLHYLPTLQLKKQQLQIKIFQIRTELEKKQGAFDVVYQNILTWIGLLADPGVDIKPWIRPQEINLQTQNIAGADIPVLGNVVFLPLEYDFYGMPFWVDEAIEKIRVFCSLLIEIRILEKQIAVLHKELMVTTQRVNLFEKVKIPECVENIRIIRIYLGDQQANAVGVSKVAKRKIEKAVLEEALT
jgi:V/A-type H+-transporting ATPase subunit D